MTTVFTNFHFEIAADLIDEEMLTVLEGLRPGQVQLEIGVQSTCPKTVEAIHRKMDFARVAEVVTRIRSRHNIHVHLDLIAGLPWEDYVRFGQSFDDVYALHPEQLQLGFLKVLKGSAMAEAASEVRDGEVTYAVRDSATASGEPIHDGDVMGIADGEIVLVGSSVQDVCVELVNRMQDEEEGDTLTILAGCDFDDEALEALVAAVEEAQPDLEVDPQRGEQPLYPVIFSIE